MYGKLVDGKLILTPNSLTNNKGGTITNPKEKDYLDNGWKQIIYTDKPTYDIDTQKLQEQYTETNVITVSYNIISLTEEEKREILQNKVFELEHQYNMCRYQRELILAENSGASDYAKDKAQEIENLAKELR